MPDESEFTVDAGEFGAYAVRTGISIKECPSCHTGNPPLLVHENGTISTALAYAQRVDLFPTGLPLITVECETCGFLWLYNRRNVVRKIKGA